MYGKRLTLRNQGKGASVVSRLGVGAAPLVVAICRKVCCLELQTGQNEGKLENGNRKRGPPRWTSRENVPPRRAFVLGGKT